MITPQVPRDGWLSVVVYILSEDSMTHNPKNINNEKM